MAPFLAYAACSPWPASRMCGPPTLVEPKRQARAISSTDAMQLDGGIQGARQRYFGCGQSPRLSNVVFPQRPHGTWQMVGPRVDDSETPAAGRREKRGDARARRVPVAYVTVLWFACLSPKCLCELHADTLTSRGEKHDEAAVTMPSFQSGRTGAGRRALAQPVKWQARRPTFSA